jgi:hypothetical protein
VVRPSGGSTTNDVARDGTSGRSSQCRDVLMAAAGSSAENALSGNGPWSFATCSSLALRRAAYSSSVSSARVPNFVGRSNDTPIELSLVRAAQIGIAPPRSGWTRRKRRRRGQQHGAIPTAASIRMPHLARGMPPKHELGSPAGIRRPAGRVLPPGGVCC